MEPKLQQLLGQQTDHLMMPTCSHMQLEALTPDTRLLVEAVDRAGTDLLVNAPELR